MAAPACAAPIALEAISSGVRGRYPREHASIMMTGMLTAIQSATHLAKRVYGVGPMTAEQTEQHAEQAIDALLNGMLVRRANRWRPSRGR